jgi:hypothetical protein
MVLISSSFTSDETSPTDFSEPAESAEDVPYRSPFLAGLIVPTVTLGAFVWWAGTAFVGDEEEEGKYDLAKFGAATTALTLAPSLGSVYADDWRAAAIGSGLRVSAVALLFYSDHKYAWSEDQSRAEQLALLSLGMFAGGVLYESINAPMAARRFNRKVERNLNVAPLVSPDGQAGLLISGTF